MSMKKKDNRFVTMAVETTMFGVGATMLGNASQSFNENPTAKSVVDATGTVYAAGYLNHVAKKAKKGML